MAGGGLSAVLSMSKAALKQNAKGIYGGDLARHEKDRELATRIAAFPHAMSNPTPTTDTCSWYAATPPIGIT